MRCLACDSKTDAPRGSFVLSCPKCDVVHNHTERVRQVIGVCQKCDLIYPKLTEGQSLPTVKTN